MTWGKNRWRWPESLDALEAAPQHHTLLYENDRVRVLETRIAPGDKVPLHTHRWPSTLYVTAWADCVRRDGEGQVLVDTRTTGGPTTLPAVLWSDPLPPHSLENVGPGEICIVSVEVKD
jgi:quercetin dioxygenase-like cupin family protein